MLQKPSVFLLFSFLLLAFSPFMRAQPKPDELNLTFTTLRIGPSFEPLKYFAKEGEAVQVNAPSSVGSRSYPYTGPSPLVFFRESTDQKGELMREPVASVNLPDDSRDFLLVFLSKKDGDEDIIRIFPIKDDASSFPSGQFRVWNLTTHKIAAQIADERILVQPGKQTDLSPNLADKQYYGAKIYFQPADSTDWEPFINKGWTHYASQRVLIILLPGENADAPPTMIIRANRPS